MECYGTDGSICSRSGFPHPKCRVCEGTGTVKKLKWRGRWRTRIEIARWVRATPEWRDAEPFREGVNLVLRKGLAELTLYEVFPAA